MQDLHHSFPGQEKDETVFVFARPYFLAFLPTALVFIVIYFATIALQFALYNGTLVTLAPYMINIGVVGLGLFELFVLIVFFVAIIDFYFDIFIVTDRRLVDIDQEQLFFRQISKLALEDVEDVTSTVRGIFPTIFNYGTVHIQTAGTERNFEMYNVKHPQQIAAITLDLSTQTKRDVKENERFPESTIIGIISNHEVTTANDLIMLGAMNSTDNRKNRVA